MKALYLRGRHLLPRPLRHAVDGAAAALGENRIRYLDLAVAAARHRSRPDRLFVGWLLRGNEDTGSSRTTALAIHAHLRRCGVLSTVLRKPRRPAGRLLLAPRDAGPIVAAGFDVVIFQKVWGEDAEALARRLAARGTRTVFLMSDPVVTGMPAVVDCVVLTTDALLRLPGVDPARAVVIEPAVEAPPGLVKEYDRPPPRDEVWVVWVGYPQNLPLLDVVRQALADPRLRRYRLVTITRGPQATWQWDRQRVWTRLLACDIAVLPSHPDDYYQAKPNARMTMLKALGLPIVASPIPSYRATLTHGVGCYFAEGPQEWADALAALGDAARRRAMGLAERDRVLERYGIAAVGGRWLRLLSDLAAGHRALPRAARVAT